MMVLELKKQSIDELKNLHMAVIERREEILQLVQAYGYNVTQLVTREFEHDIEQIYGLKLLEKENA